MPSSVHGEYSDSESTTKSSLMEAPTIREDLLPGRIRVQQQADILDAFPLPSHWCAPQGSGVLASLRRALFNLLCIAAYGHAVPELVWAAILLEKEAGDESVWEAHIRHICDHLNNVLLVAGLLLASAATFLTTEPPRDEIVNYTRRGPYMCLVGSFGLLIGGIIAGEACVIVTKKAQAYWSEKVLYADRFHVYCTLIMLSYPFFSVSIATLLLAFGLLTSVWSASDPIVQGASSLFLIPPLSMTFLFALSCATAKGPSILTPPERRSRESVNTAHDSSV
ncbi:uncharacterized protein SCHCODRAFT_02370160 [Schizophyllum commune H4-8]|uniref:uncharacterized protein n=1 Tax=Schizophyllum commune (strain H4-8 / FGSC 9210) TaxID=578458 RepID=UPI002160BDC9|nr:uncharacterized protein SCHCODRAFT_02370160 [Schizophyllum commune H4-8]KAI5889539.1 hypothetical protein SCHCODRAFT_02370160 [Schizophyllum commune H4-8]